MQTIEDFYPSGLKSQYEAVLLIEVDGDIASVQHQQEKIINLCKNQKAIQIECAQNENHRKLKINQLITWATAFSNSMKL